MPTEGNLVLYRGLLDCHGSDWAGFEPEAGTQGIQLKSILVALLHTALAGLHPIDNWDTEGDLDKVVGGGARR
jgi:hypothetical protein